MSDELIVCVGRRRLDVSVIDEQAQIRIAIGDRALAHLRLEFLPLRALIGQLEAVAAEINRLRLERLSR